MPWQETSLMDQRVQFIAEYQRNQFDLADLARRAAGGGGGPRGLATQTRRPPVRRGRRSSGLLEPPMVRRNIDT